MAYAGDVDVAGARRNFRRGGPKVHGEESALVVTSLSTQPPTQPPTQSPTTERIEMGVEAPLIFIPGDVARVLLDALAAHYGGTGDTRALRQDYDGERKRVDRMIDAMIVRDRHA